MPEHGTGKLPTVQHPAWNAAQFERELVDIADGEVMPDVVIARAAVALEVAGNWRQDSAGGERQKATVGNSIDAAAPGVVRLDLQPVPKPFFGRDLETVVVTVRTCGKLGDSPKSGIPRLRKRKRRKAPIADGLKAVDLRQVLLV